MTSWKIGQKLVCIKSENAPETPLGQVLTGYVKDQDQGWVTIACPTARLIVSRYQEQFEKDGWQLELVEALSAQTVGSLK